MHRLRWIVAGLLTISVAVAVGCLQKSENDSSCFKDVDCASGSCVSFKCIDPNINRPPYDAGPTVDAAKPDTASEAAAETGGTPDSTPADSQMDTAPADTGSSD